MSKLLLRDNRGTRFRLSVTQFRSPMSASINSVQVKDMMHHFPIRAGQPDIQFTVQFPSIDAKHEFQNFVRNHQRDTRRYGNTGMITLSWPQRDINGWTGFIVSVPVKEARFEYAPKVTFGVLLVDSMMSSLTRDVSWGAKFWSIAGPQIPIIPNSLVPSFQPPTPPASLQSPPPASTAAVQDRGVLGAVADFVGGLFS